MKFQYEYRTSDNVRHEGVIVASTRDAAYAQLKKQGIRPGSVTEAPGVFNKLFGKGKRWIAIGVLGIVCLVLAAAVWRTALNPLQPSSVDAELDSPVRRQIIGDAAVIERGIRTGWADVFKSEGDRFLASFAIPGAQVAVRSTTVEEIQRIMSEQEPVLCDPAKAKASIEARQILAIVTGMKEEIRSLQKKGWTIKEIGHALVRRQEREIGYYERAKNEIEQAKKRHVPGSEFEALWDKKNAELRRMGIRHVPFLD